MKHDRCPIRSTCNSNFKLLLEVMLEVITVSAWTINLSTLKYSILPA
jgi:hypothetical protein